MSVYTLFHLPVYITEKNDRRLFPFSETCHSNKLCICTLPDCDLPRITLQAVSLLPFHLFYAAGMFAQYLLVCPALFRFATDHVYLVRYH